VHRTFTTCSIVSFDYFVVMASDCKLFEVLLNRSAMRCLE